MRPNPHARLTGGSPARSLRRLALVVLVAAGALTAVSLPPRDAVAQVKPAVEAQIKSLNKAAMSEYDSLEFAAAKKKLLQALQAAASAGVKRSPALAQAHINLAIVYGAGDNDRIKAVKHFKAALQINRSIKIEAARATPALEEMFKSARESLGPAAPPAKPFEHKSVDEATAGSRVRIRVKCGPSLRPARVVVYHRYRGQRTFSRLVLRGYRGGVYVGYIPGKAIRQPSVYYYVEAQDAAGTRLAGKGKHTSPNIISVEKGTGGSGGGGGGDGDGDGDGSGGGGSGGGSGGVDIEGRKFSIGVMLGVGVGVVFGGTSENAHPRVTGDPEVVDIKPGGALAPMHIALELAYHLTPKWHISVLGRLQVLTALDSGTPTRSNTGNSVGNTNPISVLAMARAKRFFGDGATRFYLSFGAGGGQIRHRIPLGDYDPNEDGDGTRTPNDIVDARVAGVGVFGFGGGLNVMITSVFGLVLDLNGMILVPDFSAHLDINLGFLLAF